MNAVQKVLSTHNGEKYLLLGQEEFKNIKKLIEGFPLTSAMKSVVLIEVYEPSQVSFGNMEPYVQNNKSIEYGFRTKNSFYSTNGFKIRPDQPEWLIKLYPEISSVMVSP
jgi:hypothetical protein